MSVPKLIDSHFAQFLHKNRDLTLRVTPGGSGVSTITYALGLQHLPFGVLRESTLTSNNPPMSHQPESVLLLNAVEVNQLLTMDVCIELMAEALADLSRGNLLQPLRMVLRPPDAHGVMAMMPAYRRGKRSAYGLKAICFFHGNPAFGKDAHQGCVLLSSGETGELLAIINASAITALRTAAVSAVATKLLSRNDASELTIIGSGIQARTHLVALSKVRSIRRARVVSLNPEHPKQLAEEMRTILPFPIEPTDSVEEALKDADLIVTATSSRQPVLRREWISDGAHINAIGTYSPEAREIDSATMVASRFFVDRLESALNEAGDYLLPMKEGLIGPNNIIAEVGEVLIGEKQGRTSAREITLFKSLGLAVEDMVCAEYLYQQAQTESHGTWIKF
jgi:ornithine cyclodeaminase/alanine dehydrogenase-like protein (mu-crystallin family)